ncbi:hypothetical protein [Sphingobium boeckii]|uniref:Uncharacterized protein n=1 Tax=Sphingobium boeckii TaxID=1082345 RepID=A0A7W9AH32_9SPHN|nr:hypothetical protein [Sphingobium boeckii]MBB5685329.1 hypothetical protein [Sphingobium boeckii]
MPTSFDRSVFINCPFDEGFEPILQAMAFCITYLGFSPRLAPENSDGAEPRLARILDLIRGSKYGIHDLSRSRSAAANEYSRLNMPFELGVDFGFRMAGGGPLAEKKILVLEHSRFDYRIALSDIAGWDIEAHDGSFEKAVRKVRNWLAAQAVPDAEGPARILGKYADFQGWYYERQLAAGFSDDDIQDYPTSELVAAMEDWMKLGQPI